MGDLERPNFKNKLPITIMRPKIRRQDQLNFFQFVLLKLCRSKNGKLKKKISFLEESRYFSLHGRLDPIGKISPNKIMNGVNAALKNGGPQGKFSIKKQLATKGHIVPKHNKSRYGKEHIRNKSCFSTHHGKNTSGLHRTDLNKSVTPPIKIPNMISINIPLSDHSQSMNGG